MNKLLLFCLISVSIFALSWGQESRFSEDDGEVLLQRSIREGKAGKKKKNVQVRANNKGKKNIARKGANNKRKQGTNNKSAKAGKQSKNKMPKSKNGVRGLKNKKVKAKKESKRVYGKPGKTNQRGLTPRQDACVTSNACIKKATDYYSKGLLKKVANFKIQKERIKTYSKQASGKASKNSDFELLVNRLREAGGGNSSNLTCNGETGTGADYLTQLSATIASCEDTINDACDSSASGPGANQTYIDECAVKVELFEEMTTAATKAKGAEACALWEAGDLEAASDDIKACTAATVDFNKQVTKAKKNCTDAFGVCKTAEDSVIKAISACSPANTVEKVSAALNQATKNIAAATDLKLKTETEVSAADSATTVAATGAGRQGVDPSVVTCASFIESVDAASAKLADAPLLSSSETLLMAALELTVSPACTAIEAITLTASGLTLNSSIGVVETAIAVKQGDVETATGTEIMITTTIEPTGTTAEATIGTTAEPTTGTTAEATTGTTAESTTGTTAEATTVPADTE